jgi:hypothetical protein
MDLACHSSEKGAARPGRCRVPTQCCSGGHRHLTQEKWRHGSSRPKTAPAGTCTGRHAAVLSFASPRPYVRSLQGEYRLSKNFLTRRISHSSPSASVRRRCYREYALLCGGEAFPVTVCGRCCFTRYNINRQASSGGTHRVMKVRAHRGYPLNSDALGGSGGSCVRV